MLFKAHPQFNETSLMSAQRMIQNKKKKGRKVRWGLKRTTGSSVTHISNGNDVSTYPPLTLRLFAYIVATQSCLKPLSLFPNWKEGCWKETVMWSELRIEGRCYNWTTVFSNGSDKGLLSSDLIQYNVKGWQQNQLFWGFCFISWNKIDSFLFTSLYKIFLKGK